MGARRSRHERILRILRNRIIRGTYQGKLPGQRALARELGTNVKTICLVLAQLEVLGLVRRAERQGTFAVPRSEKAREAPVMYARLVLKTPFDYDRMNFWASLVIYGFQESARERRVSMVLEYASSVEAEVEKAVRQSALQGCVGTCILSMPIEIKHALKLAEASAPVVLADWELEDPIVPCVEFDNIDAGRLAAEHLVKLGHRRIMFVTQPEPSFPPMDARREGARHYMESIGRKLTTCTVPREDPFPTLDAVFKSPERPTGVIVVHGQLADYLMGLAASLGLSVPRDLSVIAFGERRWSRLSPITLIAMDEEALGRRALETLLDEEIWADPRRVQLPGKLLELGSTAPPSPDA